MAIVACDYCGKEFFKSPCYIKRSKSNFCSHECHNKKNAKIEFICTVCGTTFLKRPSEAKKSLNLFCSRECKSISIKDKKDSRKKRKEPIWKGDYLKTYHRWRMMIQRCTNSKNTAYYNYGGRGITVCKRWLVYNNFLDDMGYPPKETTLDRLDNEGNYCPENCSWVSRKENNNNKRNCFKIEIRGEILSAKQLWEKYFPNKEISYNFLLTKLKAGIETEKIIGGE